MINSDGSIVVQQIFGNKIKEVWNSITESSQMQQWFFEQIEEFKPEIGFKTSFIVKVEDRTYTHLWEITDVIPLKKIVYSWKYKEYNGDAFVVFELFEEDAKTKLTLTNIGLDTFPKSVPEFSQESCNEGWKYFINGRLKTYLNSNFK